MDAVKFKSLIERSTAKFGEHRSQSTGSDHYFKIAPHFGGTIKGTDGVLDFATDFECFWFLDNIASYTFQFKKQVAAGEKFFVVRLIKSLNGNGGVFAANFGDDQAPFLLQHIPFVDLKSNIKMYLISDEMGQWTLLMPEEY